MAERSADKMNLCLVACESLRQEIETVTARSRNTIRIEFLPMSLHETQAHTLRNELQQRIDNIAVGTCDMILVGYGLCNRGLVGLRAKTVPLVIPRIHDCFALFMGSRESYAAYFASHPGVYFRTAGWMENDPAVEKSLQARTPRQRSLFRDFSTLSARYGEENARHLFDQLGNPPSRYSRLCFISTGCEPDKRHETAAAKEAQARGWDYDVFRGDLSLLQRFVDGPWDESDFLTLSQDEEVAASFDERVLCAAHRTGATPT